MGSSASITTAPFDGVLPAQTTVSTKKASLGPRIQQGVRQRIDHAVKTVRQHGKASECILHQDSAYIKRFMSNQEADELLHCLTKLGEKQRPKNVESATKIKNKYPLWTKYYGCRRNKDGARALDRWGSNHESWTRIEEPPIELKTACDRLRTHFNLDDEALNSMVVNYYYDGDNTYIPAHRDTTACLQEHSSVYCLSLGAARDFVLCANEDAGKYKKSDMTIAREFRVGHGDLFALGQETNHDYCHAVTQEPGLTKLRISVIFRSVDKSFIDLDNAPAKEAVYCDGKVKEFAAECITSSGYGDSGTREHLADLVNEREAAKKERQLKKKQQQQQQQQQQTAAIAQQEVVQRSAVKNIDTELVKNGTSGAGTCSVEIVETPKTMTPSLSEENSLQGPNDQSDNSGIINSLDMEAYYMGQANNVTVPLIAKQ